MKTLEFKIVDRVAVISLNRPKAANGINKSLASELTYVAKQCDNDSTVKAILLTGNGRFFSAGGDIKEMASYGADLGAKIKELADDVHTAVSTFSRTKAPLVVAVNGMAAGAGFSLSITGDIVLASDKASFMMAYTKSGLSPDGSASYFLPRLIGLRRAQDLMLTNKILSAEQALEWGLITEVVEDGKLAERAMDVARMLAEGSGNANYAVKKLLLQSFNNSLETQMEIEGREISLCARSNDGREGIAAFIAKRKPIFE
ncbi:MAG: enoyl-CoA hydratase/isomerase family protein [Litorimonas sp.]